MHVCRIIRSFGSVWSSHRLIWRVSWFRAGAAIINNLPFFGGDCPVVVLSSFMCYSGNLISMVYGVEGQTAMHVAMNLMLWYNLMFSVCETSPHSSDALVAISI